MSIYDQNNEHLRLYFVASIKKMWPVLDRLAQILYEYDFEGVAHDIAPQLQVRASFPNSPWFDPEKNRERRWFSVFFQWGAPSDAWTYEEGEGESPEALIEIYENLDDKNLLKTAHCVVMKKDLHVETHDLGRL